MLHLAMHHTRRWWLLHLSLHRKDWTLYLIAMLRMKIHLVPWLLLLLLHIRLRLLLLLLLLLLLRTVFFIPPLVVNVSRNVTATRTRYLVG